MRFAGWLRARFGGTPPLGFCLRTDHRERWLRLHSLPGSKRYAETNAEHREVRERARAAARELLPTGSPVLLVGCEPALPEVPALRFERLGTWAHPLLDDEPCELWAAQTSWPHEGSQALADAIARDERRAAWFSLRTGEVFAPYDGGIDLIVESPARAAALRRVFPHDWFSPRADGL